MRRAVVAGSIFTGLLAGADAAPLVILATLLTETGRDLAVPA